MTTNTTATGYKLLTQDMTSYGGCQWVLDEWKETDGQGSLCGPGWLHYYAHPLLAVLHNPIHADIASPRLFRKVWEELREMEDARD